MKTKRSQIKKITRKGSILRWMRQSRGISMRDAGARIGLSDSSISHYEQGRMDISPARIHELVESYGFTFDEFAEYLGGKPLPVLSLKDECFRMIEKLDDVKLRGIYAMLSSLNDVV